VRWGGLWRGLRAGLGLLVTLARSKAPTQAGERQARLWELYAQVARALSDVPGVRAEQVRARSGAVVLVDVRPAVEREVSVIAGAISVDELEAQAEQLAGRELVLYCTIGARSGAATRVMRERGFDAYNLEGGVLAWTHVGGALERQGRPTHEVHVWSARFNLVADGYQGVW
jgi:rhodanese-related sulfurtransferase